MDLVLNFFDVVQLAGDVDRRDWNAAKKFVYPFQLISHRAEILARSSSGTHSILNHLL